MKAYNAYDNFTDSDATPITSHVSDTGHSWIRNTGFGNGTEGAIQGNKVQLGMTFPNEGIAVLLNYAPASPDYTIEVAHDGYAGSDSFEILARANDGSADAYIVHCYAWGAFNLGKIVNGVLTNLASGTWTYFSPKVITFGLYGSNITASSPGGSSLSSSDSTFQGAGKAGLAYGIVGGAADGGGNSTFDNFKILETIARSVATTTVTITPTLPLQTRIRKALNMVTASIVPTSGSLILKRLTTTVNASITSSVVCILRNLIKRRVRF